MDLQVFVLIKACNRGLHKGFRSNVWRRLKRSKSTLEQVEDFESCIVTKNLYMYGLFQMGSVCTLMIQISGYTSSIIYTCVVSCSTYYTNSNSNYKSQQKHCNQDPTCFFNFPPISFPQRKTILDLKSRFKNKNSDTLPLWVFFVNTKRAFSLFLRNQLPPPSPCIKTPRL